ncbi:flowering time control protein FCA isoform X1 [Arachis hypogaea]|uniref:flowering time control protein FCA isoform X1 n=1 Tax=Arachis hypogaea TaxID=3818 RepID=UPI000DECCC48|nr:flowering time control protein FCA isoform X1 [Arachis hypogaea]
MTYHNSRRSPAHFRPGGRGFHSSPRRSPAGPGGFHPIGPGEGFGPMGGDGYGEYGFNTYQAPPPQLSGHKRGFRGVSPDRFDGGNFAKLFVGSVPRTATEEDIRPLFEEHGNVIEVALIKDKKTGQHQDFCCAGCCFIKYATSEEADQAIRALHNQHTLPGGVGPIQVRYADGERERLGAVEYKLFVGSLNKQATVKEVEEVFSKYGRVEDVYLMRDEKKQSRGCGFVKYSHRDMALAAINALNGIYTMRGCDQPLIVRFADPKRPRQGDSRGPALGGPGYGSRFDAPGPRFPSNITDPMGDRMPPPNAWRPMHAPNMGPSPNAGFHAVGPPMLPRSGDMALPTNPGGPMTGMGGPIDDRFQVQNFPPFSQQNFNQPMPQIPPANQQQQIAPLHKPTQSSQELPPSHQSYPQGPTPYLQTPPPSSVRHPGQPQLPLPAGSLPSQQIHSMSGQFPTSQPQAQPSSLATAFPQAPLDTSGKSGTTLATSNKQQVPTGQQQTVQPLQQSPSQLAQMLSQQTQTLQASFHSSQQAFSQLQQQLQMIQPSSQANTLQQNSEATKNQSQWAGTIPQTMVSTAAEIPSSASASASASAAVPVVSPNTAIVKCNWTEHLSPEGFKYYYNSVTGESRWEKPEELTLYEQQKQQQMMSIQQSQSQSQPSVISAQQLPQVQQVQPQGNQGRVLHHQQMQQPPVFQAYGVTGHQGIQDYKQIQASGISAVDAGRYSQGIQTSQEWMWKNKPAGV